MVVQPEVISVAQLISVIIEDRCLRNVRHICIVLCGIEPQTLESHHKTA